MVAKFSIQKLVYRFSNTVALNDVTLDIPANQITVVFGPSHAGKSTLLRCLNRLNDLIENEETELTGRILLDGRDIYAPGVDVTDLRRRVGMVFALPIALPLTIYENVAYGPKMAGMGRSARLDE
ncbi:MAG: ATP-binding cassette domain-containing protein, partial [Anaerolineae bacterium]|nr:ATP-binding cassette domain-containing protein [Anaerolineae bacterium]